MISDPDAWIKVLTALKDERAAKERLQLEAVKNEPKVLFADAVSVSSGTILIGELAKILKGNGIEIGQNRLFEKLRQDGYLIKRQGTDYNAPTQRAMELGLFRVKETAITHSDGHVTISKTTKVTGKGQQYFINLFLGRSGDWTDITPKAILIRPLTTLYRRSNARKRRSHISRSFTSLRLLPVTRSATRSGGRGDTAVLRSARGASRLRRIFSTRSLWTMMTAKLANGGSSLRWCCLANAMRYGVFGERISEGMEREIAKARKRNMPVRYWSSKCVEASADE